MALTLALRLDGDASGLTGEVRISREELARLQSQMDGTGRAARQTASALDETATAAKRSAGSQSEVAQAARQVATSGRDAAREAAAMAKNQVTAAAAATNMSGGLRQAAAASKDLAGSAEVVKKHARAVNDNARDVARATTSYRQFGAGIQQAGYQVGDFFVQVASGQQPMRAFIQQGTQMVQFFGPAGAVLGALGAILGAVYIAMDSAGGEANALGEEVKDLAAEARLAATDFNELQEKIDALGGAGRGLLAVEAALQLIQIRKELPELNAGLDGTRAAFERVLGMGDRIDDFAGHVGASADDLRDLARAGAQISGASSSEELEAMADAVTRFVAANPGAIEKMGDSFERLLTSLAQAAEAKKALELLGAVLQNTAQSAENAKDPVADYIAALKESVEVYRLEGEAKARREAADKAEADARKSIKTLTDAQAASIREAAAAAASEKHAIDQNREAQEQAARVLKDDFEQRLRAAQQRADTIEGLELELKQQEDLSAALKRGSSAVEDAEDAYQALVIIRRLDLDASSDQAKKITELVARTNELARANQKVVDAQREAQQAAKKAAEEQVRIARETVDDVVEYGADSINDFFRNTGDGWRGLWEDAKTFALKTLSRLIAEAALRPIVVPIVSSFLGTPAGAITGANDNLGVVGSIFGKGSGGGVPGFNPLSFFSSGSTAAFGGPTGSLLTNAFLSPLGQTLGLSAAGGSAGAVTAASGGLAAASGEFGVAAAAGAQGASLTAAGSTLLASAPYAAIAVAVLTAAYKLGFIGAGPTSGPNSIADVSPGLGRDLAYGPNAANPLEAFTADNGGDPLAIKPLIERILDSIFGVVDRYMGELETDFRLRVANYFSPDDGNSKGRRKGIEVNAFIRGEAERRVAEGLTEEQAVFQATKFAVQEAITFASDTLNEVARNTAAESLEDLFADLDLGRHLDNLADAVAANGGVLDANTLAIVRQTEQLEDAGRRAAEQATQPILDMIDRALTLFPSIVAADGTRRTAGTQALDVPRLNPLVPAIEGDRGAYRGQPGYSFQVNQNELPRDLAGSLTTPAGDFSVKQIGSDDSPGALNFGVYDEAGELVEAFRSVSDALAHADEIARSYAESQQAANAAATDEDRARNDANRARVGLAIRSGQQQFRDLFDSITGGSEPQAFGVYKQRLITGTAEIEATSDALEQFNQDIRDAYQQFPRLTDELGPLADQIVDVTQMIADQVAALQADVIRTFNEDLDREFNALTGNGAVNSLRDLVDQRDDRLREAADIGASADNVNRNFEAAVENAFDGLDLEVLRAIRDNITDPTLRALTDTAIADRLSAQATAFNQSISDRLLGFTAPGLRDLIQLNRQFEADLQAANDNGGDAGAVRELYRREVEALANGGETLRQTLTRTADSFERLLPSLQSFRQTLRVDGNLSDGTALERYASAEAYFKEIAARAQAGDQTAQSQLEGASRSFLELSRIVNAANDNYSADLRQVEDVVDSSISQAQIEIDLARQQLDATNGLDRRLLDILGALSSNNRDLGEAPSRNAILAQASGYAGSFGGGAFQNAANAYAAQAGINLGLRPELNAQLAYVTGFNQDFGDGRFQNYVPTVGEVQKEAARILLRQAGEIPNFYAGGQPGGMVLNGSRSVDSVVANLARDEFVVNNRAVARIGVPTLSYINERGELPLPQGQSDAPAIAAAADAIVSAIQQEGNASRRQSRDDADHVANQVQEVNASLRSSGSAAAHERARPGRAA